MTEVEVVTTPFVFLATAFVIDVLVIEPLLLMKYILRVKGIPLMASILFGYTI